MPPLLGPGLTIRVGSDLSALADDLCVALATSPLRALEAELVVVPTPGIRSWLERRLATALGATARDDGIAANVDLVYFDALLRRVTGRATTRDDPWAIDRLALLAFDELGAGDGDDGRFATARRCADLFDQLFRWRPDVADDWLDAGCDEPRAALLRAIAARIDAPAPHVALRDAVARMRAGDDGGLDLPARVFLFGGDSLPAGPQLPPLIDALSVVRTVSMHLVAPSVDRFSATVAATPRWEGRPPDRPRAWWSPDVHPLMASWGAASAETAQLVAQLPERPTTVVEVAAAPVAAPGLLGALQESIRGSSAPPVAADRTIGLHGCTGDARQVEVARDAILHALDADPTLELTDVCILCPDLRRLAPHIEAVLGARGGAPALPYVLTDRSISRADPVVGAVVMAMGLLGGRFARSEVVDLVRHPLVQRRFDLAEEDVDRLVEWARTADVRWGLDGAHRTQVGLPASFEAGTWRRALDRLLLGIALPDDTVAPFGLRAIDPGDEIERVGAIADVVATLASLEDACAVERSCAAWCDIVRSLGDDLFAPAPEDRTGFEQLHRLIASIERDATATDVELSYVEFRSLFEDRAARVREVVVTGRGGVTVTSLTPLRNVPFAVTCILGLDERGLDLTSATDAAMGAARVGDRDARADLRAALLGAVLSTRSRLIVTYEARHVVSNEAVPPAAVLAELHEAIAASCSDDVRTLVTVHPRHAHGDDDLVGDPQWMGEPFSFDAAARARAVELRIAAGAAPATAAPLTGEQVAPGPIGALELVRFISAPQRTFLEVALKVRLARDADAPDDEIATGLDGLGQWEATSALVAAALRSQVDVTDAEAWAALLDEFASRPDGPIAGLPGRLRTDLLMRPGGIAARCHDLLVNLAGAMGPDAPARVAYAADLGDGGSVAGDADVYGGAAIVRWTTSSHDRALRAGAVVDLCGLTISQPDVAWRAVRIWRAGTKATCRQLTVPGASSDERVESARRALRTLAGLRRRGLAEPVPLFTRVTMQMASLFEKPRRTPVRADELIAAGSGGWAPFEGGGDSLDPSVRYCFEGSYDALCAEPWRDGDPVASIDTAGSRLLAYSSAMLEGLLVIDDTAR